MSTHWTFFTNYGHVLFIVAKSPEITLREMAQEIGITERAVQRIISDLEADGFLKITKIGRHNSYKVVGRKHLKHSIEKSCRVDEIVDLINNRCMAQGGCGHPH